MSSTNNNDGWTTVPSRPVFGRRELPVPETNTSSRPTFGRNGNGPSRGGVAAPAAFGGGNSEKADFRRQATEARAAFQAAEAREKKQAEAVAAAKQVEATNFTSEISYPTLGSSASTGAPKPAMNYKQVVKDMIAREAEAEVAAAAAAEAAEYTAMTAAPTPARKTVYRQRILDELEDDYSGPEEDEMDEDEGEINADIGTGRRRGDKGIW